MYMRDSIELNLFKTIVNEAERQDIKPSQYIMVKLFNKYCVTIFFPKVNNLFQTLYTGINCIIDSVLYEIYFNVLPYSLAKAIERLMIVSPLKQGAEID